ncbi:hypothetical protein [Halovivax sp.]|uniref:hypothetical protein n=1 Tax=Halovivax sp. TaxID=1935978 RepID=UPI0025C0A269|nr:hypothetical protein [Halovivax sp.]
MAASEPETRGRTDGADASGSDVREIPKDRPRVSDDREFWIDGGEADAPEFRNDRPSVGWGMLAPAAPVLGP